MFDIKSIIDVVIGIIKFLVGVVWDDIRRYAIEAETVVDVIYDYYKEQNPQLSDMKPASSLLYQWYKDDETREQTLQMILLDKKHIKIEDGDMIEKIAFAGGNYKMEYVVYQLSKDLSQKPVWQWLVELVVYDTFNRNK